MNHNGVNGSVKPLCGSRESSPTGRWESTGRTTSRPIFDTFARVFSSGRYVCDECGRDFQAQDDFQVHKLTDHAVDDRKTSERCDATRRITDRNTERDDSSRRSRRPIERNLFDFSLAPHRYYNCDECGNDFRTKDDLDVHKLTYHAVDEQKTKQEIPPYGTFRFELARVKSYACFSVANIGRFRGIQGENNSCYLDATLMSMFYANDTYDSILLTTTTAIDENMEYARKYLTLHIVNNMRRRFFVPAMLVLEWRRMIEPYFGGGADFDSHCEEREACEFAKFVLDSFGNNMLRFVVQPIASLKHGLREEPRGEVMMQLLPPQQHIRSEAAHAHGVPGVDIPCVVQKSWKGNVERACTVEILLDDTLKREQLVFTGVGKSLILQLPRFGKHERLIDVVVPSPFLYVSSYNPCVKARYELRAVVVIGTSHFVSYLRVPAEIDAEGGRPCCRWLYCDSMSDRTDDENVPFVADVTEELRVLEMPNADSMIFEELTKRGRDHLRRIVQDMSMVFYCWVQ